MTLAFLGEVPSERLGAAIEAGRRVAAISFELPLEEPFYRGRARMLWARAKQTPPLLVELAADLREALRAAGFALERRAFLAHLTLLRDARKPREPMPPLPRVDWRVNEFVLARSTPSPEGSRYAIVERFALR